LRLSGLASHSSSESVGFLVLFLAVFFALGMAGAG
jgi:hypothetical protein